MDARQIAGVLILDELGIPKSMEGFSERLEVQKAFYLARAAGLDLGYYHGWYLRGPYCSRLASDMFATTGDPDAVSSASERWTLEDSARKKLAKLRSLIAQIQSNRPRWLELLASVHYLIDRKGISSSAVTKIKQVLAAYNKDYTEPEVRQAISQLRQASLINPTQA